MATQTFHKSLLSDDPRYAKMFDVEKEMANNGVDLERDYSDDLNRLRARAGRVKAGGNIQYNPGWHLALDMKNMIDISEAVTRAALARTESRGAHTREDYPDSDKDWGRRNVIIRKKGDALLVAEEPLPELPDELKALVNLSD